MTLTEECQRPRPVLVTQEDHWEISQNRIVEGTLIGSGNFGNVYKGIELVTTFIFF